MHGIFAYGFVNPLSFCIELLNSFHLVEGILHHVTQHLIHSEPHSPKPVQKLLSISLSRILMEHPMYLWTSANQIHWSFVLESSFSLGSVTLWFMHLSKVPQVCISMGVLMPEIMTDSIKAELKLLSSEKYPDWLVSLFCRNPVVLLGICQPDAELFWSNGAVTGFDQWFLNYFSFLALVLKSCAELFIPMGTLSFMEAGGLVTLGIPCPWRVF